MSSNKKRLTGSFRYSVGLEPKTTEFKENMQGKVVMYDGKHPVKTVSYSSFDQLAKSIFTFWEDVLDTQLNLRRFTFWLSEFLDDFGISDVEYQQLNDALQTFNDGIILKKSGHNIREAKIVHHEPVKTQETEKPSKDYKSILKPSGEKIREAKVVYDEPVVEEKKEEKKIIKEEKEEVVLGDTAKDVRSRLKSPGIPIREAKVVYDEPVVEEKKREALKPVGTLKDPRQIDQSSAPKEKGKELKQSTRSLPLPDKQKLSEDDLAKPSKLSSSAKTKSPEMKHLPALKKEEIRSKPPERTLLKPSEVLRERDTIFEDMKRISQREKADRSIPPKTLNPPETKKEEIRVNKLAPPKEKSLKKPAQEKVIAKPSKTSKTLKLEKPKEESLEDIPQPKEVPEEDIPSPKKLKGIEKAEVSKYGLEDIKGIGDSRADDLKDAGYNTVPKLANSSISELTKIKGIGKATAEKIIANAKTLLEED